MSLAISFDYPSGPNRKTQTEHLQKDLLAKWRTDFPNPAEINFDLRDGGYENAIF
jgi:hypothetical protein